MNNLNYRSKEFSNKFSDSKPFANALKEGNKPSWITACQTAKDPDVETMMQTFRPSEGHGDNSK